MKQYDVIIIGAGPGGIYSAWELAMKKPELRIAVFDNDRHLRPLFKYKHTSSL